MERLVPALKDHFDSLQDRLRCFYELQMQAEGWFKGELLFVLRTVHIAPFDREARLERGRVDLTVTLDGATHYVELKHWHIGRQGDAVYSPRFYLLGDEYVGIVRDLKKLARVPRTSPKWLLVLMTKNPGPEAWQEGLSAFHHKFGEWKLTARTAPETFPSSYFLGLLSCNLT